LNYLDRHISASELEVQKIIYLQRLANQLPDSFVDSTTVTKSHIPTIDAPIRIEVLVGQNKIPIAIESKAY
jgi:hypothetical protein